MRFLVDESCDFAVVRALRSSGHDVAAVSDIASRAEDSEVINLAMRESRILLTEDKDFGQLVYSHGLESIGVILLRLPSHARKQKAANSRPTRITASSPYLAPEFLGKLFASSYS
jgi:predicted nuclease of predicted toxin-antitoxin system